MGPKVLLVDGHNLLFRMFFGIPARIPGCSGQPIHAVVGFIGSILRALSLFESTHLMVVFDSEGGSFRNVADTQYKSDRPDWSAVPDGLNPFSQLQEIRRVLDYLGWRHAEPPGVEADDVIAAYARDVAHDGTTVILSTDSDLLQLVGGGVSVFCPRGKRSVLYETAQVESKYGVAPCFVPDLKALMGDKADNLAGVPGVGPVTASGLIRRLGGVPEIFSNLDAITRDVLRARLEAHRERAFHNLSMIRLDHEVCLPHALADLAVAPESRLRKTMDVLREMGIAAAR